MAQDIRSLCIKATQETNRVLDFVNDLEHLGTAVAQRDELIRTRHHIWDAKKLVDHRCYLLARGDGTSGFSDFDFGRIRQAVAAIRTAVDAAKAQLDALRSRNPSGLSDDYVLGYFDSVGLRSLSELRESVSALHNAIGLPQVPVLDTPPKLSTDTETAYSSSLLGPVTEKLTELGVEFRQRGNTISVDDTLDLTETTALANDVWRFQRTGEDQQMVSPAPGSEMLFDTARLPRREESKTRSRDQVKPLCDVVVRTLRSLTLCISAPELKTALQQIHKRLQSWSLGLFSGPLGLDELLRRAPVTTEPLSNVISEHFVEMAVLLGNLIDLRLAPRDLGRRDVRMLLDARASLASVTTSPSLATLAEQSKSSVEIQQRCGGFGEEDIVDELETRTSMLSDLVPTIRDLRKQRLLQLEANERKQRRLEQELEALRRERHVRRREQAKVIEPPSGTGGGRQSALDPGLARDGPGLYRDRYTDYSREREAKDLDGGEPPPMPRPPSPRRLQAYAQDAEDESLFRDRPTTTRRRHPVIIDEDGNRRINRDAYRGERQSGRATEPQYR